MPGSLFPRSPSLVPEEDRHVRFESEIPRPRPTLPSTQQSPLRRMNLEPSVKAAVDRFRLSEDDAGPSILLPSPTRLPAAVAVTRRPSFDTGRIPLELHPEPEDGNISGEIRVKGKQKELIAARAEQQENERRRITSEGDKEERDKENARDKERIRMLEQEISRLKEEVGYLLPSNR